MLSFVGMLVLSKNLFIFTNRKNKNLWEEHLNLEKKENSKDGIKCPKCLHAWARKSLWL